jgi:hypothetical protein
MKKIAIFLFAGSMLAACSKENQTTENPSNTKKSGDYSALEYYENPDDVEETLAQFVESVADHTADPEDLAIERGIYLLEGAINYKYRHAQGVFDAYDHSLENEISIVVELTNSDEMTGSSLYTAFSTLDAAILDHLTDGVALHVVDISVDTIIEDEYSIELTARPIYGLGSLTSIPNIGFNAQADRQSAVAVQCDGVTPKPNHGADYTTLLTMRKFTSNLAVCNGYTYFVNVQNFNSLGGSNFISDDNLWGNPNAIAGPTGMAAPQTCVSIADLEDNRDQAFSDVSALMAATSLDFISVKISVGHFFCCPSVIWMYGDSSPSGGGVHLGEEQCSPLTPSF